MKAEGVDLSEHEGAGAIWGGGVGAVSQQGRGIWERPTKPIVASGRITKRRQSSKPGMRASFYEGETADEAEEGEDKEEEEGEGEEGKGEEGKGEEEEGSDSGDEDEDEENY